MNESILDAERWGRLKPFVADLAELEPNQRRLAMQQLNLAGDDLFWIENLLTQLAPEDQRLHQPLSTKVLSFLPAFRWQLGDHIGPYVIDGFLGSGGMGEVFSAHPLVGGDAVALKVLRQGLDRQNFERFSANEQRALQRLDDPRIARFIDAFALPNVGICLVIERVEGEAINLWCDARMLAIDARLDLFVEVCHAVGSAHQQLVVHRDLKPANVLVTAAGKIKLLDFGVAKLLDDDNGTTQTFGGLYTLDFAAPEQILREPVTTTTDVYALGVLLFHLLTGNSPYLKSAHESLVKAVLSDAPRRLTSAREKQNSAATKLDHELDLVIARAMEKLPRDRYRSVSELANDVLAIRHGVPIRAGGNRWRNYAKFARRHPTGVAMSILLLLTLVVTTVISLHWAKRAQSQAAVASMESARAKAVSDFLVGLFQVSDPAINRGDKLTANQILDQGTQKLASTFANQPRQRASLQLVIAEVYVAMGEYERAKQVVEPALSSLRTDPTQALETAHAWRVLAQIAAQQEAQREAISYIGEAEALLDRMRLPTDSERANLALLRSRAQANLGDFADATAALTRARHFASRLTSADAALTANIHACAADLADDSGQFELAKVEYRLALAQMSQVLGDDHYRTVAIRTNFAGLLVTKFDDFATAQPMLEKALAQWKRLRGADSAAYATTANTLGELLRHRHDYVRAAALFQDSERAYRALGGLQPARIWPVINFGNLLDDQGQYLPALAQYQRALEIIQRSPDNAVNLAQIRLTTASTLIALGRYSQALEMATLSLTFASTHNPPDHPNIVNALKWIGFAHYAAGDKVKANAAWTQALAHAPRTFAHRPEALAAMRAAIANPQTVLDEFAKNRAAHPVSDSIN
jgi:eukaryotic-like serine/threonine-protein kinase